MRTVLRFLIQWVACSNILDKFDSALARSFLSAGCMQQVKKKEILPPGMRAPLGGYDFR